jgi:hypothetical protein
VTAAGLALCLAAAAPAAGVPAEDGARAGSTRVVRLGEPFEHSVALRHEPGERVELLPPPDLAPFALRGSECRTTTGERSAVTVCTLSLQLLDLGEHEIPALRLRVTGPGGERLATSPGATVRGAGAADPGAAAGPLRAPAAPPVLVPSWRLLGRAAAAAAAAALLAWLLVRFLRRRRPAPAAAALPPRERLARQLSEILALELPRRGRGREHVLRVCGAVRRYLAAAAPGAALDLTSAELAAELRARPARGVDAEALRGFLGDADLVKFARHEPGPAECEAATAFARRLLERTRPGAAGPRAGEEAA